jgi:hypothetical protein
MKERFCRNCLFDATETTIKPGFQTAFKRPARQKELLIATLAARFLKTNKHLNFT